MKSLALFIAVMCAAPIIIVQGAAVKQDYCFFCLYPIWHEVVHAEPTDLCSKTDLLSQALSCLKTCDAEGKDRPESYKIRQLVLLADIAENIRSAGCSNQDNSCNGLVECFDDLANYDHPTGQSYNTLFNLTCGERDHYIAAICLHEQALKCGAGNDQVDKLLHIVNLGFEAACFGQLTRRRCLRHGRIYEVYPGSDCNEYMRETAAYGPSINHTLKTRAGYGFSVKTCKVERRSSSDFFCPKDTNDEVILSEPLSLWRELVYGKH